MLQPTIPFNTLVAGVTEGHHNTSISGWPKPLKIFDFYFIFLPSHPHIFSTSLKQWFCFGLSPLKLSMQLPARGEILQVHQASTLPPLKWFPVNARLLCSACCQQESHVRGPSKPKNTEQGPEAAVICVPLYMISSKEGHPLHGIVVIAMQWEHL